MTHSSQIKARLFFTYLKDKTELFLYVKPRSTYGSAMVYRRAPSDAAMNLRIQSLLDNVSVSRANTEIWILLYPPEIFTTTLYVPTDSTEIEIAEQIRVDLLPKLPYSVNYDWKNYLMKRLDNGNGEDMVTVTILGKDVLPRIRSLLFKNYARVSFIGDGLQFLKACPVKFPQTRNHSYKVILPYDELFYEAAFRSGVHVESRVLTHACSKNFGDYLILPEQVYLDLRDYERDKDLPQIQPIVRKKDWIEALLIPAAFPNWYIANNCLKQPASMNFVEKFMEEDQFSSQVRTESANPIEIFLA